MISSILCYFNIHTGKFGSPRAGKSWTTTPSGVVTVNHYLRQERYCAECNTLEAKEVEITKEIHQPWAADYAKNVADLGK